MLVLRVLFVSFAFISPAIGVLQAPYAHKHTKNACTKPSVRKEWRAFTIDEKAAWIRAVNCLSRLPHDTDLTTTVDPSVSLIPQINASSSYYDGMLFVYIHFTGLFLPWHRMYLHFFEQALKEKCGYTGVSPYWNWTIDAPDFFESSFLKDSNPESGLGGWGDPNADFRVSDGGFSSFHLTYPSPHTLRRSFTLKPFRGIPPPVDVFFPNPQKEANSSFLAPEIEKLLETSAGDYKGFQAAFEAFQGAHSSVHMIMGGDDLSGSCPENAPSNCTLGPTWSPNEPLFWMHHAMVDKVWYDWQHRNLVNAKSYFGGSIPSLQSIESYEQYPNGAPPLLNLSSTMPADGMFPEVTIGDVMDTTSGILCYVYE
ncbi:Di-copper centre-containing protein [Lactarius quietus]|nr:Di-copper centre-containing protein [Lactarius quietus]